MKLLNGTELAGFIKQQHAGQVRALQASKIYPKLAIVQAKDDPVINTYVRLKNEYGSDIGVAVDVHKVGQSEIPELLNKLTTDESVHGIIIQLPLPDPSKTDEMVNLVDPKKDVDALGEKSEFEPATPMAILWLLSGYNIDLAGRKILLIGRGKLVGAPLEKMLRDSGHDVVVIDREIPDLANHTKEADVIITATGSPAILYPDMIKQGAVVVDAGVASEEGKTVGDLASEVYQRDDLTITPEKGGVGPLTVSALFENVIRAAQHAKD
ncbi:MAG: tetrahydrofolate dehydrogenase/cyclohydrolase catalytic domain-containing protein [Candidatus Saccharimonadales bacterium]